MASTNDETELGRTEKLAAAKKKLKQFQQRHKGPSNSLKTADKENDRPLSAAYAGISTESLAESSKSADKFYREPSDFRDKRNSVSSLPPGAGSTSSSAFHHDEQRSPFHRIKRPSESSECSSIAANTPNVQNSNYSETKFDNLVENNPFQIPFSQQILDEEACTSDIKEMNNQKIDSVVDMNEEENSEQQKFAQLVKNYRYFNENRVESVPNYDTSFDTPSSMIPNYDSNVNVSMMNDDEHNKLSDNLNNFDKRGRFDDNLNSNVLSSDEGRSKNENILNSNTFQIPAENNNFENFHQTSAIDSDRNVLEMENASLKQQNDQLQSYCQQIVTQLNELNVHYTQLHAAYGNLSEEHNGHLRTQHLVTAMNQQNQNQNDLQNQIQQHIQTMSVLVEEKTDLQSQLRQAMDIANKKHLENEELQGRLKASRERLSSLEKEFDMSSSVRSAIETTLQRQSVELERVRKESAQFQAKLTELQQDKSELSSRLKVRNREFDVFTAKIKEAEKQIQMKDIYIQQLTGGQQTSTVHEIEQVRQENHRLQNEIIECRQFAERWKYEAEQSNERYESYGRQLNLKIVQLSGELEKASNEKMDLETKYQRLETELNAIKNVAAADDDDATPSSKTESKVDENEFSLIRENNASLKDENQKLLGELSQLRSSLLEKEKVFTSLNENLKEKDDKIRRFEEFVASDDKTNLNVQGLLEQLHNEKATSSRAVAQNLALKNQLLEIEDKFVAVTQNEMEMATKLSSAEHSVQLLGIQLAEKTEEMQKLTEQHDEKYKKLQSQINADMKQEYDRKQFEDRLNHYEATQKATQDELIRCRNEINHLTVENASLRMELTERSESLQKLKESSYGTSSSNENQDTILRDGGDGLLRLELNDIRQRVQHLTAENSELHRIMEQNAADENQNTIHVELRQAVERMTSLSRENEDLRRGVVRLRDQLDAANEERRNLKDAMEEIRLSTAAANSNGLSGGENNKHSLDDHSSVCSEHYEQRREAINIESFDNMKKAMDQLQSRFTRALTENADLSDQNEQLEHLIMQLQNETETIGEYVTLYQHQRKIIRERLREKEDYVARLSREKEEIQGKLLELQRLVMHLLKEKGALRSYAQYPPTHLRPPRSPPSKMPERPRNLSETLVDETALSHDQPVSTVGDDIVQVSDQLEIGVEAKSNQSPRGSTPSPSFVGIGETSPSVGLDETASIFDETTPTAERILKLLMEMQRPDLINTLPPSDRSLHCKYCTGKLMML